MRLADTLYEMRRASCLPRRHLSAPRLLMRADEVLAVIVSYNGLYKTRDAVNALRGQVGHIHVVDNASGPESLAILDSMAEEHLITLERLNVNRGVGYALNRGVQYAKARGYSWLLTMDQDSIVDSSLIKAYHDAVSRDPGLVCLSPTMVDHRITKGGKENVVDYAITSGNLVSLRVFDRVGLYDEGFFIDGIDFDFCLRLRKAGYFIYRVNSALMRHQLGEPVDAHSLLRKCYVQHGSVRRYYMCRNFLYMVERYFVGFPRFIGKLALSHLVQILLIGFLDPSPLAAYRAIIRGIQDYIARKTGPYVEPIR